MVQDRISGRQAGRQVSGAGDSDGYLIDYLAGRPVIQVNISSNIWQAGR